MRTSGKCVSTLLSSPLLIGANFQGHLIQLAADTAYSQFHLKLEHSIRDTAIKDIVDSHYLPRRMVKIKMVTTPSPGKDEEQLDHSDTADENVKYAPAPGKNSLAGSCEAKRGISV